MIDLILVLIYATGAQAEYIYQRETDGRFWSFIGAFVWPQRIGWIIWIIVRTRWEDIEGQAKRDDRSAKP